MYYIYCHTFPNGKRYVGITRTSPERRWGKGRNYTTCPLMNRAIQKYGWENILHEVIDTAESKKAAEVKERHYIGLFMSDRPEHGYNVLPGGDVVDNPLTDEIRYKLGNGQRGRSRTEEEKARISAGVKEKFSRPDSNGHIGMHVTDSTRQKMSESQTERWSEDRYRREAASARMRQRMSDPEFRNKIIENLSQYRRKPGEWQMSEEAKIKIGEQNRGKWIGDKSPCSKPVLQYDTNGNFIRRWANAGEVERAGIANRSNVSKCCQGKPHVKTVGGFVWRFEE
jgi:group I intron endonuclease